MRIVKDLTHECWEDVVLYFAEAMAELDHQEGDDYMTEKQFMDVIGTEFYKSYSRKFNEIQEEKDQLEGEL